MNEDLSEVGERLIVNPRKRNEKGGNYWAHMDRYVRAAGELSKLPKPAKVLDAASGTGYGTYILSKRGGDCVGVEISKGAVHFSNGAYGGPSVRFLEGNVAELNFPDDSFDLVVSFETIEHLNQEDQGRFLNGIKRVLRTGGKLIISAPVTDGGVELPEYNKCHQYEPDPDEFVAMIKTHFQPIAVLGQIIRPRSVTARESTAAGESSRPSAGSKSVMRRLAIGAARPVRAVARLAVNALFERYYLRYPSILELTIRYLYGGYRLRPIDLTKDTAAHLVIIAVKN